MIHSIRTLLPALMVVAAIQALAQDAVQGRVLRARVMEGDTVAIVVLPEAQVTTRWRARDRREVERFDKLTRNVIRVYPYARITGNLLREYEHDLAQIGRDADRELYLKLAEAELRAEFEAEVKDLTISQGRVLIKLIDRETGRTSFDLVKDLKGGFQAFVWQGLARLFGQDLRSTYDPLGEDRLVEVVVSRIERGELAVADRPARTAKAQARLEKRKTRLYRKYGIAKDDTSWLRPAR